MAVTCMGHWIARVGSARERLDIDAVWTHGRVRMRGDMRARPRGITYSWRSWPFNRVGTKSFCFPIICALGASYHIWVCFVPFIGRGWSLSPIIFLFSLHVLRFLSSVLLGLIRPSCFGLFRPSLVFCSVPSQFLCDSICTLQMVWCGVDSLNVQWSTSQTLAPLQCELQPWSVGHDNAAPPSASTTVPCTGQRFSCLRRKHSASDSRSCASWGSRRLRSGPAATAQLVGRARGARELRLCSLHSSTKKRYDSDHELSVLDTSCRTSLPELHCSARFHKVRKELLGKLFRARK